MNAVYFVRQPDDRFDPVRENWRMGRMQLDNRHYAEPTITLSLAA